MFNFRSDPGHHGAGYIILNVLRALNIIVLILIAVASVIMMIFAKLPNAYQLFADITHFFLVCVCALLILSELPGTWLKAWISKNWPIISEGHGFTWLGTAMVLMGCHILGTLSHGPYVPKKVGKPVCQAILAGGILSIAFGFFNIIASFLFKDSANCRSAREVRQHGAVQSDYNSLDYSTHSTSVQNEKRQTLWGKWKNRTTKLQISSPIAVHDDLERGAPDVPSSQDRNSPILPGIQRPPTALHPYNRRHSRYSEASDLSRYTEKPNMI